MQNDLKTKVPPSGSLGLLAYGARGIRAWRLAKQPQEQKQQDERK